MEISQFARKNSLTITDVWQRVRNGQLLARTSGLEFHIFELNPESFQPITENDRRPGAASAGPAVVDASTRIAADGKPGAGSKDQNGSRMPLVPLPQFDIQAGASRLAPIQISKHSGSSDRRPPKGASTDHLENDEDQREFEALPKPLDRGGASSSPGGMSTEVALLLDHLSLAKEENREILRLTQDSINRITHMAETMMAMKDEILSQRTEEVAGLKKLVTDREQVINRLNQEVEDFAILTKSLGE